MVSRSTSPSWERLPSAAAAGPQYVQVLDDTLIGQQLEPYGKRNANPWLPPLYFFDVGLQMRW
jgi:hypothetical protein